MLLSLLKSLWHAKNDNGVTATSRMARGLALSQAGNYAAALILFSEEAKINPGQIDVWLNQAATLHNLGRFKDACMAYQQALDLGAEGQELFNRIFHALNRYGRHNWDWVANWCRQLVQRQPDSARAWNLLGICLQNFKGYDDAEAMRCFENALRLMPTLPQAHWNRALGLLLGGDLAQGLREFEWRRYDPGFMRPTPYTPWTGEPLSGKTLLLTSEQGLGDILFCARYVPYLAAQGTRVILEAPAVLHAFLRTLAGVAALRDIDADPEQEAIDFSCPIMSLPLYCGMHTGQTPPYLSADAKKTQAWQARLGEGYKVGIAWCGSSTHRTDWARSIPLAQFLLALPAGVRYVCLQPDITSADRELLQTRSDILVPGDAIRDFSDSAALCAAVDQVVTVDTSVAHIAGALGRPTWMLVSTLPDWRWGRTGASSPWYPSVRLYRQQTTDNWTLLLKEVHADLADSLVRYAPESAQAKLIRGSARFNARRYDEALADYEQALSQDATLQEAHKYRAITLGKIGALPRALAAFREALALMPEDVELMVCYAQNLLPDAADEAMTLLRRSIALAPNHVDAQVNWAGALLLCGHYEAGWRAHEWRLQLPDLRQSLRSVPEAQEWRGETALTGKTILLYGEQGFGDVLQFCRYVPFLANRGARVVLLVYSGLTALLEKLAGVDLLISDPQDAPPLDFRCPLLSLPLAFGIDHTLSKDAIPNQVPYLQIPVSKRAHWQARVQALTGAAQLRVGIVWRGRADHANDLHRSIALPVFIAALPQDVAAIVLHKPLLEEESAFLAQYPQIHYLGDEVDDFADTAALCAAVDVVLTVDTSVAHLAGALARPTWVLLPYNPDWRWLLHRADTDWYPTLRLYRQQQPGNWDAPLAQVRTALSRYGKQPA